MLQWERDGWRVVLEKSVGVGCTIEFDMGDAASCTFFAMSEQIRASRGGRVSIDSCVPLTSLLSLTTLTLSVDRFGSAATRPRPYKI